MLTRNQHAMILSKIEAALTQRVSRTDRPPSHRLRFSQAQISGISQDCFELYDEYNSHQIISVDEFIVLLLGINILCDIDYGMFYEHLCRMMTSINNYKLETGSRQPLTQLEFDVALDTTSLYTMIFGLDDHQSYLTWHGILASFDKFY